MTVNVYNPERSLKDLVCQPLTPHKKRLVIIDDVSPAERCVS
jgi:hypothetical protein